jgi:hypothetical protein
MANQGLPKGEGQGEIAKELGKTNAQVFGLIGKQQQQLNSMNRGIEDFVSAIDAGNDSNEVLLNSLIYQTEKLVELFRPVSSHFSELSEGQSEIKGAAPASVNFGAETGSEDDTGGKEVEKKGNFLLDMLKNLTAGVGGLVAGVGGAVGGLGLGALGLGLRGLAPGLIMMANPATALGGTVLVAFLAGLAGVAYLSGKAMQEMGEGFSGMGQGLDDLAAANVPEGEKLTSLATALGVLFNSFDTGDAIKMAIMDGTAFTDMGKGLTDLSNAEFSPQAIDKAGTAIAGFFDTVGFGDAAKSRILDGSAFGGLASGLQALNDIDIDPANLERAGLGANKFLSSLAGFKSAAGAAIAGIFEMDFHVIAGSIEALDAIDADAEKLEAAGIGLRQFLYELSQVKVMGILKTKFLNEKMFTQVADGLLHLNDAGMTLDVANIRKIRDGLLTILEPAGENFKGIIATQMVDDNLIPMAKGMRFMNEVGSELSINNMTTLRDSSLLMQEALSIPFKMAVTTQMIDDNLKPFAMGLQSIDAAGKNIDVENFKNLKNAMSELQKAFLGEDGKSDGIKEFFTGKDDFTIPIKEKDLEKLQGLTGFIGELSEADFQGMEGDIYKIVKAISDMNLNDDDFNGFDLLGKKMNKFIKIVDVKAFEKLGKALPDIATASKTIGGLNLNTINLKDQAVESDVKAGGGVVVSPTTDNSTIIQNNNSSTPVIKPASYSSPMPPAGGGMRYII